MAMTEVRTDYPLGDLDLDRSRFWLLRQPGGGNGGGCGRLNTGTTKSSRTIGSIVS